MALPQILELGILNLQAKPSQQLLGQARISYARVKIAKGRLIIQSLKWSLHTFF